MINYFDIDHKKQNISTLYKFGLILFISTIILTGSYFRSRSINDNSIDILVILRLLVSIINIYVGISLLKKAKISFYYKNPFLFYLLCILPSVFLASNFKISFAYYILLAGSFLLIIGLVFNSSSISNYILLESIWFWTMFIIVIKDSYISYSLSPDLRLGTGITSPAFLGTNALILYILSNNIRSLIMKYISRIIMLVIIYMTWTRIVIIGFIVCYIVIYLIKRYKKNLSTSSLFIVFFFLIIITLPFIDIIWNVFNRNQDQETINNLAGRWDIWSTAIILSFDNVKTFLFGYGYGLSQYNINWKHEKLLFVASHCHNDYIEHYFSCGIVGLLGFMALIKLSIKSFFHCLATNKHIKFYLNLTSVIIVISILMFTEIPIGGRPNPISIIFIIYLCILYNIQNNSLKT